MIELVSPIGRPRTQAQAARKRLGEVGAKRVGFVWNQYQTTRKFWPRLEAAVEDVCKPSAVQRAYKSNTWMPLEQNRFSELTAQTDYLVVGVGA